MGSQGQLLRGGASELEGGIEAIRSLNKHLLSTHCVPSSVLGHGDTTANTKDQVPALMELML